MKLITEEKLKALLREAYRIGHSHGGGLPAIYRPKEECDILAKLADEHEPLTKEVKQ